MKKYLLPLCLFLLISVIASAQNFKGQWKGTFLDKSTSFVGWGGDKCDYVLELEVNGKDVSGYSYTYFTDGGKKYYTICSLKGFINKPEKYIEIKEIARTKTNVPVTIRNCFQVHKLTYKKLEGLEQLEGSWVPAPGQDGDCGFGNTSLQRRSLKKVNSFTKPLAKKAAANKPVATGKTPVVAKPVVKAKTPVGNNPAAKTLAPANNKFPTKVSKPVAKAIPKMKEPTLNLKNELDEQAPEDLPAIKKSTTLSNFEKRNNTLIKTIEVENTSVKVDLYDNGEIDGDSISLFYNGKLLLSHKRLTDKPISLNITVDNDKSMNDLVMYAENLGTIPPNTALMIVTDGPKRYEVRITSDLQKSGAIRFTHKPSVASGD